jgi:diaminobutyrate-2-oxoglutarate transaminase
MAETTGAQPAPALSSEELLARQAARESRARAYPRRLPLALARGEGIYVTAVDGATYIDCLAGAGALALGHNHPVVVEAIQGALAAGIPLQGLDFPTPTKDEFIDELFASLPPGFAAHARIQFCGPTGADGVEAAIKLVKTATGRGTLLSFTGGYHGMSQGAMAVSGDVAVRQAIGGVASDVTFLPYPHDYRCPFGVGGEQGVGTGLRYIEGLLDDPLSGVLPPAGMILELVQGEGGAIPAPDDWVRGIRRITEEHDIALIVDEVQTGLGRTGRLYAFEQAGILPDVIVVSKAVGGGLPLAVVLYHERFDVWEPGAHAGTFRGNQLAMAAGTATLRYLVAENLASHAHAMGERLMSGLRQTQAVTASIGDVRGRGLLVGVEIVDAGAGSTTRVPPPDPQHARRIQRACLQEGLIIELGGRAKSVLRFLPPLIVSVEQVDLIVERFGAAVEAAERLRPATAAAT